MGVFTFVAVGGGCRRGAGTSAGPVSAVQGRVTGGALRRGVSEQGRLVLGRDRDRGRGCARRRVEQLAAGDAGRPAAAPGSPPSRGGPRPRAARVVQLVRALRRGDARVLLTRRRRPQVVGGFRSGLKNKKNGGQN